MGKNNFFKKIERKVNRVAKKLEATVRNARDYLTNELTEIKSDQFHMQKVRSNDDAAQTATKEPSISSDGSVDGSVDGSASSDAQADLLNAEGRGTQYHVSSSDKVDQACKSVPSVSDYVSTVVARQAQPEPPDMSAFMSCINELSVCRGETSVDITLCQSCHSEFDKCYLRLISGDNAVNVAQDVV